MVDWLAEAQELFEYTQFLRRDFHRHPELGFQEFRTSGVVARELNALGLEVTAGVATTGVVALIEGAKPGPVVMLRFDMDALPIVEESLAEYTSTYPGVMHACGHDGHTAIGLTVARLLQAHWAVIAGTVKLVFQPAEEGLGGAEGMIDQGVLENPRPDVALGLHLWNDRPVGWLGITAGPAMASSDIFQVKITGKGGLIASELATTVIGGLVTSTLLTLIVIPVVYSLLDPLSRHGGDGGPAVFEPRPAPVPPVVPSVPAMPTVPAETFAPTVPADAVREETDRFPSGVV